MWLVAELFEALPEAGDLPKPKLVVFLDEAHLLFDDATDAFLDALARTVRLIRSKGVGVFFVTQQPTDLSEEVLAQLGLRDPARAAGVHAERREEAARDGVDLPALGPLRRRDAADLGRDRRGGGHAAVGEGRPDAGRAHAACSARRRAWTRSPGRRARRRRRRCGRSTARGPTPRARARSSPAGWRRAAPRAATRSTRRWSTSRSRAGAPRAEARPRAEGRRRGRDRRLPAARARARRCSATVTRGIFGMLRKKI